MIIRPDFLEHWKTRMLCNAVDDEAAPLLLLRLWSYCQNAKNERISNGSPEKLKAICRYTGDAMRLWNGMTSAGWVVQDGNEMVACGWRETNAALFNSWESGSKGGRPPKPTGTPRVIEQLPLAGLEEPTGNPRATLGLTDKRREEKSREDENETDGVPSSSASGKRKAFVKPTVEDVAEYCIERKNDLDPEAFVDHYESNGWMVGKTPMKNWQSAVRTWEKNHHNGGMSRTQAKKLQGPDFHAIGEKLNSSRLDKPSDK
jgi:hypothetical protein